MSDKKNPEQPSYNERSPEEQSTEPTYLCPFKILGVKVSPAVVYVDRVHTCVDKDGRIDSEKREIFSDHIGRVCCFAGTQYVCALATNRSEYIQWMTGMFRTALRIVPLDYFKTLLRELGDAAMEILAEREKVAKGETNGKKDK